MGIQTAIQCLYDKAIGFYQKALRIHQHILGELHPEIAVDYNEIGHAYFMQRKLCKALDYLERSFFILRDTLGESDPQTLSCLRNLLFFKTADRTAISINLVLAFPNQKFWRSLGNCTAAMLFYRKKAI